MQQVRSANPAHSPHGLGLAMGLVAVAALARLAFIGLPNVAPVAAMALFGGAALGRPLFAFGVPLLSLALSDLAVNAAMVGTPFVLPNPWVYGSFAAIGALGFARRGSLGAGSITAASVGGSVLFFVATNLGVWLDGRLYPLTGEGLAACYTAAVPFFWRTLAGDLLFNGVLFGSYAVLRRGAWGGESRLRAS